MDSGPAGGGDQITIARLPYGEIEAELPPAPRTNVSVHLSGSCTLDWMPDRRTITGRLVRGQLTVVPAGRAGLLRVRQGRCEIVKIGISDAALSGWEPEQRPAPLIDRFGVNDPLAFHLALALLQEHERAAAVDTIYRDALSGALVAHLLRRHAETERATTDEPRVRPLSRRQEGAAVAFMQDNLTAAIGLDDVARELHLSTSHFAAQFRRSFGTTPARYLTWLRLDRARALLEAGQLPVTEIARRVGFRNTSHFSQAFRAEFGRTPTQWRTTSE